MNGISFLTFCFLYRTRYNPLGDKQEKYVSYIFKVLTYLSKLFQFDVGFHFSKPNFWLKANNYKFSVLKISFFSASISETLLLLECYRIEKSDEIVEHLSNFKIIFLKLEHSKAEKQSSQLKLTTHLFYKSINILLWKNSVLP